VATERERQPPSRASATASATDGGATLPAGTIESGRAAGYRAVLKVDSPSQAGSYTLCLLAALSFFATSHGTALLLLALNCSTGFVTEAYVRRHPVLAGLQGAGLTALWSVASFIPFARIYDRWYAQHPRLRCQPDKVHSVQGYNRSEVRLALFNLIMAAVLSAVVVVTHVLYSWDKIYTDVAEHGYPYLLASTVAYFLLIDGWAYAGHRFLHIPVVYRAVHKWHHAYRQPTAFSGLALHPVDMLVIQGGVYAGFYLFPMHVACIAMNLLYVHYFNVVDHSGVYSESWLPWQPSSLYHDDHHKCVPEPPGPSPFRLWWLVGLFFHTWSTRGPCCLLESSSAPRAAHSMIFYTSPGPNHYS